MRFWELLDDLSHRLPWLPQSWQNWICDRFDRSLGGEPESTARERIGPVRRKCTCRKHAWNPECPQHGKR